MPLYFFDLISNDHQIDDPDGQECQSLEEAVEVAKSSLCEIAGTTLRSGADVKLEAIIMKNSGGYELARVTTEDAILPRFKAFAKFRWH